MNEVRKIMTALVISIFFLSGCDYLPIPKEGAIIALGEEDSIQQAMQSQQEKIHESFTYPMKVVEVENKQVTYMSRLVFDDLLDRELIYQVKENGKLKKMKRLQTERSRFVYAENRESLPKEIAQTAVYEGDILIGKERLPHIEAIVILPQDQYESIEANEKTMHVALLKEEDALALLKYLEEEVALEEAQYIRK